MLYDLLLYILIGAVGTELAIRYARSRSLIDQPGERRSHVAPTPRGGGIAIVVAVSVAMIMALVGVGSSPVPVAHGTILAFLAGFLAVAAVGWMDDHNPLPAGLRLLVHALAAALFASAVWHVTDSPWYGLMAFVSAVVLTNVWNFMDGINGLAASQVMVASGLFATLATGVWQILAIALAGASLAFIPFNFPRARIFLGDVGSGALGFAIAALFSAVLASRPESDLPSFLAQAALLSLPFSAFLVDAGLTLARRVVRGERWWTPHVQHAYQAWARDAGHVSVTLAYGAWTLLACAVAFFSYGESPIFILSSTLAWYTSGVLAWAWIQRSRMAEDAAHKERRNG